MRPRPLSTGSPETELAPERVRQQVGQVLLVTAQLPQSR